jgi:hypothetical protein
MSIKYEEIGQRLGHDALGQAEGRRLLLDGIVNANESGDHNSRLTRIPRLRKRQKEEGNWFSLG